MVEFVRDEGLACTRLWVSETVDVTVLNQGADWDAVRERVMMFSRPMNSPSGCPRFQSTVLGLPVVRYMSLGEDVMVATEGSTALRLKFRIGHDTAKLDELAAAQGLVDWQIR